MTRVAILTNIPSPYRVDLFAYLQQAYPAYEFHIIFASRQESNRSWEVSLDRLDNAHFFSSYTRAIDGTQDTRYVHLPRNVWPTLSRIAPDVVVASEYNPSAILAMLWARRRRKPFVSWTDGTLHSEREISRAQRLSRRWIVRGAAAFIASSSASRAAQIAYGADAGRVHISFLTVDIDRYWQTERTDDGQSLLYVGRLSRNKGVDLLLDAMARVKRPFTLTIVGDGPDGDVFRAQTQRLGIGEHVHWPGFLEGEALRAQYRDASALVFPTRNDCFGLTTLEAMCAGLPVIGSVYAGGSIDLIVPGKTGYIVDPVDAGTLANAVERLLADPAAARAMGVAGQERARDFAFERVAPGFVEAIEDAMGGKNGHDADIS